MMKFFLILLLVPAVIVFGLYFLMRRMKRVFFINLNRQMNSHAANNDKYSKGDDIIYNKDNITVLKGEAKDND